MVDIRNIFRVFVRAFKQFNSSGGWVMASHIALSLMMAIFPFMIFSASLASYFGGRIRSQNLTDLMFKFWPVEIAGPMAREVNTVLSTSSVSLLTFGITLTLFFASNGVEAIRTALQLAYKDTGQKSTVWRRLQSVLFVVLGGALMLVVSFILVFLPLVNSIQKRLGIDEIESLPSSDTIASILAFILLVFAVFSCHRWLPGEKRSISALWPGIAVTLLLWIISTKGFALYLSSMANYSATYAGLAAAMSAQIFLYLIAAILIFGAEINAALWRAGK